MDFFTVPTLTGRVLFVVIVLSHVRRRIVHFNITEHPTAEATAQQVVDAFPDDTGEDETILANHRTDQSAQQRRRPRSGRPSRSSMRELVNNSEPDAS